MSSSSRIVSLVFLFLGLCQFFIHASSDEFTGGDRRIEQVQVKFAGYKSLKTSPLPLPTNRTPDEFFLERKHRNYLFSGGDSVEVIAMPTKTLFDIWAKESKASGGHVIGENVDCDMTCEIVRVKSKIKFPGLQLVATNVIGCKLTFSPPVKIGETVAALPEYQFTLIDSSLSASGLPPAVWLFNKLTGCGEECDVEGEKERMTSAFTRIRMEPDYEGNGDKVLLITDSHLEVRMKVPFILLSLLPFSIDSIEKQGSSIMQKNIEKNFFPGLVKFWDAYEKWLFS